MKILYIDNKKYIHNSDIHIDFISSLERYKAFKVIGYGNFLKGRLRNSIRVKKNVDRQLDALIKAHRPDAILTYDSGSDSSQKYSWISDKISKVDIPKFHITTDYMKNGFDKEQADWLEYIGYKASIFRTKDSLRHPLGIDKFLLPFSIDAPLYRQNIVKDIKKKDSVVGFVGTSFKYPGTYPGRRAAIKSLRGSALLKETKYLSEQGRNQMIFGRDYVKFLTNNLFNLTCGGHNRVPSGRPWCFGAKHFQIPAAYSMLVCTDSIGIEDFPEGCYIKYDIDNMEKLIEDVQFHISNKDITEEKIRVLYRHVIKNHNHRIRGEQLKGFIERYL